MYYEHLLMCYCSGQISEPEFQKILSDDEVFRKWIDKKMRERIINSV
jgi:hypothetical protein